VAAVSPSMLARVPITALMGWLAVLAVAQVVTTLVQRESAVVAQRDKVILDTVLVQVAAVAALALLLLVSMEALARQIASQEPR